VRGGGLHSETISFRLGGAELSALGERASAERLSPHALARRLVTSSLHEGGSGAEIEHAIGELREELVRLRGDLETMLEVVLLNLSKDATKAEVQAFVKDQLRR